MYIMFVVFWVASVVSVYHASHIWCFFSRLIGSCSIVGIFICSVFTYRGWFYTKRPIFVPNLVLWDGAFLWVLIQPFWVYCGGIVVCVHEGRMWFSRWANACKIGIALWLLTIFFVFIWWPSLLAKHLGHHSISQQLNYNRYNIFNNPF